MIGFYRGSFYFPIYEYPTSPGPYARINKKNTAWYLPATPEVIPHIPYNRLDRDGQIAYANLVELSKSTQSSIESLNRKDPIDFLAYNPPPLSHQMDAIQRGFNTRFMALAADCGLGKTYITLHLIEEMKQAGLCAGALVLCPSSLVEEAWMDSTPRFTDLTIYNLRKQHSVKISKGKYRKEYTPPDKPYDVYVINYEQIAKRYKEFLKLPYNIFVSDESTRLKNGGAIRVDAAYALSWKATYRWLLSGAMAPNGPEDYWNQFYTMDEGATLGTCHWYFMESTHKALHPKEDITKTFWVPTASGTEEIRRKTRPLTLVYKIRDCIDLPEMKMIKLMCELSPKQRKAYNELREELCTIVDGEYVIAKNSLSVLEKFGQVTGGFARTDEDELYQFKDNPKMDVLLDMIKSIDKDEKIIIWAWRPHEVRYIAQKLEDNGFSVEMLHGGMQNVLSKTLKEFRGDSQVLVANQAVLGHGHNFTFVHYMFFYSNSFDFELRHQAISRIPRIGQKNTMFVYDLVCRDTVDVKLLSALESKDAMRKFLISTGV